MISRTIFVAVPEITHHTAKIRIAILRRTAEIDLTGAQATVAEPLALEPHSGDAGAVWEDRRKADFFARAEYVVRFWYVWISLSIVSHYIYRYHKPTDGRTQGILLSCMYTIPAVLFVVWLGLTIARRRKR